MKKVFMFLLVMCAIVIVAPRSYAITYYTYTANSLIGGVDGSLDNKDGTNLKDGDTALVITTTATYHYILDADSAAAESSPDVISPDANAGDKRWVLVSVYNTEGTLTNSAGLAGALSDETGAASGSPLAVFNQAPQIDNIELGHATDTTLSRVSAGVVAVEGSNILLSSDIATTISDPGSDSSIPSEQAVREAIDAVGAHNKKDAKLDFDAAGDGINIVGLNMQHYSDTGIGCDISSSSTTLDCDGNVFKSGFVGYYIVVGGAGAAGEDLVTTIDSYTDANTVELADSAGTTVTDEFIKFGQGGCSIDASDQTLTCTNTQVNFVAGDIGKIIGVVGAGAAGETLSTTIASINSTTSIELTDAASTSVYYEDILYGTDDTTSINNAVDWADTHNGTIYFPSGIYLYSDESVIDDTATVVGDGMYSTIFMPAPGYTGGWFLTINDTWNRAPSNTHDGADGGSGITSRTTSPTDFTGGVILKDFSIHGNRDMDNADTNGIRTYNRADRLFVVDVGTFELNGTGESLGSEGGTDYGADGNLGTLRESVFIRNEIRGCGTQGSYPAWILSSQDPDVGITDWVDSTDLNHFYSMKFVYNYAPVEIIEEHIPSNLWNRSNYFINTLIHGWANYQNWQSETVYDDLLLIKGAVRDLKFIGGSINGGAAGYAQIRFQDDTNGDAPLNVEINLDARQYYGDNIVIEEGNNIIIKGTVDNGIGADDALVIGSSAIDAGYFVFVDWLEVNNPTYTIDATEAAQVFFTGIREDTGIGAWQPNKLSSGTTLPSVCFTGELFQKTDATSGQQIYACESANTWALQGDGGGYQIIAGDTDVTAVDSGTGEIDFAIDGVELLKMEETTGGTYHTYIHPPGDTTRLSIGAADGTTKTPRINFIPDNDGAVPGTAVLDYGSDDKDLSSSSTYFALRNNNYDGGGNIVYMLYAYQNDGISIGAPAIEVPDASMHPNMFTGYLDETNNLLNLKWEDSGTNFHSAALPSGGGIITKSPTSTGALGNYSATAAEMYGGYFYFPSGATSHELDLPAIAEGMNFEHFNIGTNEHQIDPNGSENFILDGVQLSNGYRIGCPAGDNCRVSCRYFDSDTWECVNQGTDVMVNIGS